ncbi:MAG: exodeoxyribonuclease VII small subunit [Planctomycetota bacterium]|nr:MAG: exodeoxyribonuclease VII small subunit [Planctomycetota bacterium]
MAKTSKPSPEPQPDASFEESLARLENLVEELESGDLSLEEGVARYREGVGLLQALREELGQAEAQVEELSEVLNRTLAELEGEEDGGDEDGA